MLLSSLWSLLFGYVGHGGLSSVRMVCLFFFSFGVWLVMMMVLFLFDSVFLLGGRSFLIELTCDEHDQLFRSRHLLPPFEPPVLRVLSCCDSFFSNNDSWGSFFPPCNSFDLAISSRVFPALLPQSLPLPFLIPSATPSQQPTFPRALAPLRFPPVLLRPSWHCCCYAIASSLFFKSSNVPALLTWPLLRQRRLQPKRGAELLQFKEARISNFQSKSKYFLIIGKWRGSLVRYSLFLQQFKDHNGTPNSKS